MKKINTVNLNEMISSFVETKKPHEIQKTGATTNLIFNNFCFKETKNGTIKKNELFFIKKVKDYCLKNSAGVHCNRHKIKYISEGKIKKHKHYTKDIYEIDLNAAYWNFAHKFNFISDEIFKQGEKISKKTRLISLGNLAKSVTIMSFNGENYEFKGRINSPETEGIFWTVSLETDKTMTFLKTISDKNFLFYWVDAIFFQSKETKKEIENYLNSQNIPFKIRKIKTVYKDSKNIIVTDKKGIRKFFYEQN